MDQRVRTDPRYSNSPPGSALPELIVTQLLRVIVPALPTPRGSDLIKQSITAHNMQQSNQVTPALKYLITRDARFKFR